MKVYPGAALVGGDQTKEFTAMRQGVVDMAVGSTINWSPQVAELNLFSLPFLMPDHKAIDAITGGEPGKKLFEIIAGKEVVPLAWGENGFRELSNSKHEVRKPADLKGLKIRVVGSPLFNETFTALGANPTQMSWADAQPALSTGAVDGQENPLTIFTVAKLHTVGQKFVTLWGYVADPLIYSRQQAGLGRFFARGPEDPARGRGRGRFLQQGAGAQRHHPGRSFDAEGDRGTRSDDQQAVGRRDQGVPRHRARSTTSGRRASATISWPAPRRPSRRAAAEVARRA